MTSPAAATTLLIIRAPLGRDADWRGREDHYVTSPRRLAVVVLHVNDNPVAFLKRGGHAISSDLVRVYSRYMVRDYVSDICGRGQKEHAACQEVRPPMARRMVSLAWRPAVRTASIVMRTNNNKLTATSATIPR